MRKSVYLLILLALFFTSKLFVMAVGSESAIAEEPKVIEPAFTPGPKASEPTVTAEPTASATVTAAPTASAAVTAEPTASAAVTAEPMASASVTAEPSATKSPDHELKCRNPVVNARSAILMDASTGEILYKKNSKALMAPASTTKIMTAILVLENLSLDKKVKVSKRGVSQEGTSVGLRAREKKTVRELLYGLLLESGNDAAKVLAKAVSGSEKEFAVLMTKKAKQLGMTSTKFKNASGLPAVGHRTTAYDMAILTRYALKNGHFATIVKTKGKTISGSKPGTFRNLRNHNKLLRKYPYATGVKTGYTILAGGCLVSSATHNGKTMIAVVLKTHTIYDDCIKMFNYGFGL